MHIIFGKEKAEQLSTRYTVLELDTFKLTNGTTVTSYCAVETLPIDEIINLNVFATQHEHLLINYRGRAWVDCQTGIAELKGKWRGELDSFYTDLAARVHAHMANPPPADWTAVIEK
jgi:hypothetical protein